jgi:arginine:pyruvate transaminase
LSGADFASRLLDDERIAVMPGESFGTSSAGHLRLALTTSDADIEKAMTRIIAFSEELG